jgi:Icc-related predicted phosphoesterase
MKIVCISDTHNKHKEISLNKGDVLIHAGDATGRGEAGEILPFLTWFSEQKFSHKILVAGNHDFGFERSPSRYEEECKRLGIIYLNDSGVNIEGINIWGSPVQPEFFNWAFNRRIEEKLPDDYDPYHSYNKVNPPIKPHWDLIPNNTDILITHGPPLGVLDTVSRYLVNLNVGCPHLMDAILRVKPKLHVFGHIHEQQGILKKGDTVFVNASQLNDRYMVAYKPKTLRIDDKKQITF